MSNIFQKLTSRKFWMAVAGIATGVAIFLGADGSEVNVVAGAVTTIISSVAFIITEGKIDAERVKTAIQGGQAVVDTIQGDDYKTISGFGGDQE